MELTERFERATTCAFTGHRPRALPWGDDEGDPRCLAAKKRLDEALERAYGQGYRHFICGMAQGGDLYFGEAVVRLRLVHPELTLEGAVPFPDQCRRWPLADQQRYYDLLDKCDMETLIQQSYTPHCMHRRNRYMVDHASRLIALYNGLGKRGGTLSTLQYAMGQNVEVEMIEID
ncbi:MAG: DUF1273 domain-containing protein [Oscillospiraceae bacterium]|jgi:uncharacterized phage-like protein YoqJ